ncbi:MAG TPA: UDP-glucose/GDP-mannose dehydrogenase family protein [Noviherbaspirillum sp.]|uniref:UDP-glucose dehydrogenase family protein n=1 Tax=Noviherbaspirillum sp. TaxID=1926288 RepID=UPI002D234BCF|nr:UDP-glucose/GDP-mannose dehydrogenase family protein [Noviherbaspirillum sp.]HYD96290.1 UDP-glucose/GDP-mannose dehydrogenase family protein [Noviherbaspirillum sp.]
MNISIIGSGYVGLVSAACFAEVGNAVLCMDIDAGKIGLLDAGILSIHEPGLPQLVAANKGAGRLAFTASYDDAVRHGDIIFLAVGTPAGEDGSADLSHVIAAAREIGRRISRPVLIVTKSTVPVGTVDQVRQVVAEELQDRGARIAFSVLSNPEFLKEGAAVGDFMRPDRIVIGGDDPQAIRTLRELYVPFNHGRGRVIETDARSAELTKYAANAMLATRISLMNELANLADAVGADIEAVRRGMGADPRIGPHFLHAGMGYGGSCFPKDVKALVKTVAQHGGTSHLLAAVEIVNDKQKRVLFEKICAHFGGTRGIEGKTFALWGLSFKPDTGDMREAPSLVLIDQLLRAHCRIQAYDPVAGEEAARVLRAVHGDAKFDDAIRLCSDAREAADGADALALVTEWQEFRSPDFHRLAEVLRDKVLFDGRNLYNPEHVRAAGLRYHGIGRNRE